MLSKRARPYDPESLDRHTRLRRNVGDLLASNHLAGSRISELVTDVNNCAPNVLRDLRNLPGARPDNSTRRMRHKFLKKSHWMPDYIAEVRCWDPATNSIKEEKLSMQLIHEIVAVLRKNGIKSKILDRSNLDPLSLQHLLECETASGVDELLGLGIWGDGAPTQWDINESIDVISLFLFGCKEFQILQRELFLDFGTPEDHWAALKGDPSKGTPVDANFQSRKFAPCKFTVLEIH